LVLIEGAANLAHTVGWRQVINNSHRQAPLLRLFRMGMAGYAINYLTPTAAVGGELSRAALLASSQKGSEAVSSVLVDKLTTGVAHVLLAVLGALLLFWRVQRPFSRPGSSYACLTSRRRWQPWPAPGLFRFGLIC